MIASGGGLAPALVAYRDIDVGPLKLLGEQSGTGMALSLAMQQPWVEMEQQRARCWPQ